MTVQRSTSEPSSLTLVRTLRQDRPALSGDQIDGRLVEIEQSLQRMLTVADVAEITGESPKTIYQAIARGQLPARRDGLTNRPRVAMEDAIARKNHPRRRQPRPATSRSVETRRLPSTSSAAGVTLPQNHEEPHGHRQSPEA